MQYCTGSAKHSSAILAHHTYPVPAEEAREDAGAEMISYHVYEYKVLLRANGKEHWRLELVQKRTTIGEFHLECGRYHMSSYKLAARCREEPRHITHGNVSLHCDYGKRMGLSFNKEIQSQYYQNTLVSVKGGQTLLSSELGVTIDAQVEVPGHGKWWLDGKTGSNKRYYQQCMCSIITLEAEDSGKHMLSAKWIDHGGELVAVSPATECVRMLSNPACINGVKSKGMRASHEGKAKVERNTYECYTMANVDTIPNYKIEFPNGKFNGLRAYYNIRTDPDLGLGFAALRCAACGCDACKQQLKMPWLPCIDMHKQL